MNQSIKALMAAAMAAIVAIILAGCPSHPKPPPGPPSPRADAWVPSLPMKLVEDPPPTEEPAPITGKKPIPPPPVVKPTRVLLWATLPDLAADPRSAGITELAVYSDPALWWDPATTQDQIKAAAQQITAASWGLPVYLCTWSFGTPLTRSPGTATAAEWGSADPNKPGTGFLDHVRWWKAAGTWKGVYLDGEQYAPAAPWVGSADMAARGKEFAQTVAPLQAGVAVAYWQVRQGLGTDCRQHEPSGSCMRRPIPGFFSYWKQTTPFAFLNEFYVNATGSGSAADIKTSLPTATVVPGVWVQMGKAYSIPSASYCWIYVDPGTTMKSATERDRLKKALGK